MVPLLSTSKANPATFFDKIRVLDGGMGSLLSSRGFKIDKDVLWSARVLVDHPQAIVEAHKDFLKSGAEIIETCSYQASLHSLQKYLNMSLQESEQVVKNSVKLARQAIEEFCKEINKPVENFFIAGSIGSFGVILHDRSEYTGSYMKTTSENDIFQYYNDQIKLLINAGVDLLAIETIPSLEEAKIIAKVVESLNVTIPIWIAFYCINATSTGFGDKFSDVIDFLSKSPKITAIGLNCIDPLDVEHLLQQSKTEKPFVVYPGFEHTLETQLADFVPCWISEGAKLIGGCCNVSLDQIQKIRQVVDKMAH